MEEDDIRKSTAIKKKYRLSKILLEFVPKSCEFKPLLTMADDRIQGPFEVKPIAKDIAGTRRVFPCKLYRIEVRCMYFSVIEYSASLYLISDCLSIFFPYFHHYL